MPPPVDLHHRVRHHVVLLLGIKRVSEVNVGEIERFFRDVAAGKSASDNKIGHRKRIVVRGGDGAARKVFRDLSAVFTGAILGHASMRSTMIYAHVEMDPSKLAVQRAVQTASQMVQDQGAGHSVSSLRL